MVFSSLTFLLLFLPVVLLLYYLLPKPLKNFWLLLASLVFYAWGEPVYVLLMLYSILLNYLCGLLMAWQEKAKKEILIFGILMNLFVLGFFKYQGFVAESLSPLFLAVGIPLKPRQLALPIGISFYTFQALSYLIDLYRGYFPAQKNPVRFALYITMFPQLIAGPIVRYETVERQLEKRTLSLQRFGRGAVFFIEGLAMKVLIANNIGAVYEGIGLAGSAALAWTRAFAYFFQIYFDFAGYSAMAIGLGCMLGFDFPENFRYPYLSASITEFWRRWHISLGTWFREYVYIPLGGNRRGAARQVLNILIVWALTGLWHGAAWNFVLWGLYYGLLLLIEKFFLSRIPWPRFIGWLFTTVLVVIGWVFFSTGSLGEARAQLSAMFGIGTPAIDGEAISTLLGSWRLFLLAAVCATPLPKRMRNTIIRWKGGQAIVAVAYLLLFAITFVFLAVQNYNPFLYFRF